MSVKFFNNFCTNTPLTFCIFSTGGRTHGSGRSHDELSAIRVVIQRGGGDSLPRTQYHGLGDGFILRPIRTGC